MAKQNMIAVQAVRIRDLLLSIDDPRADKVTLERVRKAADELDGLAFEILRAAEKGKTP